jgi:uncharacterized membrane protein
MYTGIPSHTPTIVRVLGALALLVIGSVHFQQYEYDFHSSIPTIVPLFLANFVAASALGLLLLSPVRLRGKAGAILDLVAALTWEARAIVLPPLFVGSGHTTVPSAPDAA